MRVQLMISNRLDYGTAPVTCGKCGTPMLPNPKGTAFAERFVCDRCAEREAPELLRVRS
jgi:formylmethanofuran dehydrogenase subunit E